MIIGLLLIQKKEKCARFGIDMEMVATAAHQIKGNLATFAAGKMCGLPCGGAGSVALNSSKGDGHHGRENRREARWECSVKRWHW